MPERLKRGHSAANLPMLDVGTCSSGGIREHNEDRVETRQVNHRLLALVADGMGGGDIGAAMSDQALKIAAESLQAVGTNSVESELQQAFQVANQAIRNFRQVDARYARSGSTLTCAVIQHTAKGVIAHLGHVGDSRAYLVRGATIKQLSRDHNIYEDLRAQGVAADQARKDPHARKLTYCLGSSQQVTSAPKFYSQHSLQPGDSLILCTDGVSEFVAPTAIGDLVNSTTSAERTAQKLVALALKQGSTDNASCVVVGYVPHRGGSFLLGRALVGLALVLALVFGGWALGASNVFGAKSTHQFSLGAKTSATITALPTALSAHPTSTYAPGQPTSTRAPTTPPTSTATVTPLRPTQAPVIGIPAAPARPTQAGVPTSALLPPTAAPAPPTPASTAAPAPPTSASLPPTSASLPPTPAPAPPTAAPAPPTPASITAPAPPTSAPLPPTAAPAPPTTAPLPPTAAPAPPTTAPTTAPAPPTSAPLPPTPAPAPPTPAPPTPAPPTSAPLPPTAAPAPTKSPVIDTTAVPTRAPIPSATPAGLRPNGQQARTQQHHALTKTNRA